MLISAPGYSLGPFSAGWMEEAEVSKHIAEAVEAWRDSRAQSESC